MLSRLRRLSPKTLKADLSAGLATALVAIPDGIAAAILAGLNPIHGLYALMIGTPIAPAPRAARGKHPGDGVIDQYAHTLQRGGATLMLAEVSPPLHAQLVKTGTVEVCGAERVFIEQADVFASTRRALQAAVPVPPT